MAGARIQLKRGLAAQWTASTTVLLSGEIGYETDTDKFKIGDGSSLWTSLDYFNGNLSGSNLNDLADVTITSAANGDFLRWNGTAWINDAVNLSTDTVGDYVGSLVAGTGVTLANNSGEGATPTVTVDTSVIQARVANVTDTEIGYLDGVTSAIQTQLNSKPLIVPLTNKVYIDYLRADSYTATGTREYPYKTLAAAYTAAAAVVSSTDPMVLVLLSGNTLATAENITFAKGHLFLTAENSSGTHAPIIFYGSLTFAGPNATISENHFSVSNIQMIGVSGTPPITFSGSYPQRLFIKDTWITAEGSAHGITMTNTGASSSVHTNDSKFSHNGSGHYHCIHIAAGTANLDSIETSGAGVGVIGVDGGTCNLSNSEITSGGTYAIDVYAGGSLTTANCKIVTTAANSSGIKLNTATAYAVLGNTFFNVPTSASTGRAIYGVTGTALYYSNLTFSPGSNVQIDSVITKTQIDDFGGPKATYTAAAAYTDAAISGLVDSAPGALNTLNELAAAINDDASYAATITTALGLKAPLESPTFTGTVTVPDNTIALGTKTTGDYVATITGGTGVSSTAATTGEGTTHTLSIGQAIATTDSPTFAGLTVNGASVVFEGVTANDFETTLTVTDPTADRTITIPDATGTVAFTSDVTTHANLTEAHGATGAVVGTTNTQTLTNKTLTSPKVNEDVVLTATATELNVLDGITSSTAELNILDGVTATAAEINTLDGITSSVSELNILDGATLDVNELNILDGITSSTSELNILDGALLDVNELNTLNGITATTAELNILDGALLDVNELNILNGVTATTSEINILDGATLDVNELNILDGVTATASEINILDGATLTTTELNYVDGVTSSIQTQMDLKAPLASPTFTGTVTLPDDTVALGTKTTGDYVATITGGTGITSTALTTGEGTTHSLSIGQAVATTDNVTFAGVTADAIRIGVTAAGEIDTASGNLTIDSAGGTVTIDDNLTVTGDLTVSGTTTSINTETLTVDDNIIVLNNNVTGSPTENAGIEVERGTSANVLVRWNETSDKWEATNDGTTYGNIVTSADSGTVTSTMIADGTIVDGDINASAAIAHSKLANATAGQILLGTTTTGVVTATTLSGDVTVTGAGVTAIGSGKVTSSMIVDGTIVDGDINASAGIALSKLATSTAGNIIVYNSGGVPTAVAETGDVTISDTGVTAIGSGKVTSTMILDGTIVNGDINASAAIDLSKLASGTSAQVIVANGSGVPTYVTLSGDVTISNTGVATIQANSVALGTDTTGSYVTSLVAGTGITLSNNSGESATPTVAVTANTYDAYGSARNLEIKFLMEVM